MAIGEISRTFANTGDSNPHALQDIEVFFKLANLQHKMHSIDAIDAIDANCLINRRVMNSIHELHCDISPVKGFLTCTRVSWRLQVEDSNSEQTV